MNGKTYLGQDIYAQFDGVCFVLTTESSAGETNRVVLDPSTLLSFEWWLRRLREGPTESLVRR